MGRKGIYKRKTRETDVEASICLDGSGGFTGGTGFGFFDHMLEELAFHGMFDISLSATGDATGNHHLCEDAGICLGRALAIALKGADEGGGPPITRFGWSLVPMDGSLARAALDLSGRGGAWIQAERMDEDIAEFLKAFARESGMNLHLDLLRCDNSHHGMEAAFKSLAIALRAATRPDERRTGTPSSKGTIG